VTSACAGLWADVAGLRGAMLTVAALAVGLTPGQRRLSGLGIPDRCGDVRTR
jgi:hypothetical protein